MATDRAKILDKIKKCLALGASSNEHEAAAAMRQARKLMEAHGITEAAVEAAKASAAWAKSTVQFKPAVWESNLACVVASSFGCNPLLSSNLFGGPAQWKFIGCGPAPEVAAYTMTVLLRQVRRARADYISTRLGRCKTATKTARADVFCIGWVETVGGLVQAFARPDEQERAVQAYLQEHHSSLVKMKPLDRTDKALKSGGAGSDFFSGKLSGLSAQLNRGVGTGAAVLQIGGQ